MAWPALLAPAAKALMYGSGAVTLGGGALGIGDYVSKIGEKREEELIKRGTINTEGDYSDLGLWDKLWVDEDSLLPRRKQYELKEHKKNPQVAAREALTGKEMELGQTVAGYLSGTQALANTKAVEQKISNQALMNTAYENSPAGQREIADRAEANKRYYDQLNRELADRKEGREERALSRKDDLEYKLLDLGLREQAQADKMDIYRQQVENQRADRRHATTAALISGLATLGTAFAL